MFSGILEVQKWMALWCVCVCLAGGGVVKKKKHQLMLLNFGNGEDS